VKASLWRSPWFFEGKQLFPLPSCFYTTCWHVWVDSHLVQPGLCSSAVIVLSIALQLCHTYDFILQIICWNELWIKRGYSKLTEIRNPCSDNVRLKPSQVAASSLLKQQQFGVKVFSAKTLSFNKIAHLLASGKERIRVRVSFNPLLSSSPWLRQEAWSCCYLKGFTLELWWLRRCVKQSFQNGKTDVCANAQE